MRWPRSRVAISDISSALSEKSNRSKFSRSRSACTDFGKNHEAIIQVPAQHDLRRGLAVFLCQGLDHRVAQHLAAACQWAPGLGGDAFGGVILDQFLLLQIGMQLDLVNHGRLAGLGDQQFDVLHTEVRHADGGDAALFTQAQKSLPGIEIFAALRAGPVDEVEVEPVELELLHALVEGPQRAVVTLLVVPQLGGDEQLLARQPGAGDGLAHAFLVLVNGGGIDVPVADLEGVQHGLASLLRWYLEHAEAELRDLVIVFQGNVGNRHEVSSRIGMRRMCPPAVLIRLWRCDFDR